MGSNQISYATRDSKPGFFELYLDNNDYQYNIVEYGGGGGDGGGGEGTGVSEPATRLLLGSGLIGLAAKVKEICLVVYPADTRS